MINRVLIRLKIIQIVYAYYQNGSKNLDSAEKELFFSLSKAYDLYNYLLMLMIALTEYAQKRIDAAKAKLAPTTEELYPNRKFVDNKFIAQLEVNKQLTEFIANQKRTWTNDQDFIKELYEKIVETDIYKDYMASDDNSYEADRELWRKIYKTYIFNNDSLDQVLEDQSLYWNDDKEIVDTFVLKTIKRFDEKKGANQNCFRNLKMTKIRSLHVVCSVAPFWILTITVIWWVRIQKLGFGPHRIYGCNHYADCISRNS